MAFTATTCYSRSYSKPRFAREVVALMTPCLGMSDSQLNEVRIYIDCQRRRLTDQTVYQRIYYGWNYLCQHMDPTGEWKKLWAKMRVTRKRGNVIVERLNWRELMAEYTSQNLTEEKLMEQGVDPWQVRLVNWVENAPEGDRFRVDAHIPPDKLVWVGEYLRSLTSIIFIEKLGMNGLLLQKNKELAAANKYVFE